MHGDNMSSSLCEQIRQSRILLQNPYAYLDGDGFYSAIPRQEAEQHPAPFKLKPEDLRGDKSIRVRRSITEIESVARKLQREMWVNRERIWTGDVPTDPIDLLKPSIALEVVGYDFELRDSLGQFIIDGETIEVAGIIDNDLKLVHVSRQFTRDIRNFTAAHELGHAILHDARGLHRDRPLDGASTGRSRGEVEIEADKFATFFLMPEKLVRATFQSVFGTGCFTLNEDTAFALTGANAANLMKNCSSLRDLSKILASTEQYNGAHFHSMAKQFRVSIEAMAIRLEELGLLNL